MRGLPIVNANLDVEAVGFSEVDGHQLGVLITPWFMNLVVLPASEDYCGKEQGEDVEWTLPAGDYTLTTCHDEVLGGYLTAVLFRTVADFPDQGTARDVAATVLEMLFEAPQPAASTGRKLSRRELFAQLGAG